MIRVADLHGGYVAGTDTLRGLTFGVPAGRLVAVLGPNGGGKTTLFRALLDELPHRRGTVDLDAAPAYVPQTERARLDFPASALDVALMGAYARTPWYRRITGADHAKATRALERVGLADRARTTFGTLSGGQRQRVLIARALVQDAPILLLDEPLAGVDAASAAAIETLFAALRDEGRVLLVATHDVELARRYDDVLCVHGEQCGFGDPATVLTHETLQRTYGAELIVMDCGHQAIRLDHHDHEH